MRQFLLILVSIFLSISSYTQVIQVNGLPTVLTTTGEIPDDLKAIQHKKYLSQDYKPSYVDDMKERAFLRYNIYDDQMEFIKDGTIYYLVKDEGRRVRFADKTTYRVYDFNGKKSFFLIHSEGKNSLIAKLSVRFVEAKKAGSGYEADKPADFKRRKDELYFVLPNKGIIKVPSKKKEFFNLFGSESSSIKDYMMKNKLNYKKSKDLKMLVTYMNTI